MPCGIKNYPSQETKTETKKNEPYCCCYYYHHYFFIMIIIIVIVISQSKLHNTSAGQNFWAV